MDSTIGKEEQNLVRELACHRGNIVLELSKQGCEIGRTSETDAGESLSVQVNDTLDANNVRVSWVSIDSEAMVNTLGVGCHSSWDSTEAVDREAAVSIIRLNNLADVQKSFLISVVFT